MKQYIPIKLIKRGFKILVIADALNGYFCDLIPYVGGTGGSACLGLGKKSSVGTHQTHFGSNH